MGLDGRLTKKGSLGVDEWRDPCWRQWPVVWRWCRRFSSSRSSAASALFDYKSAVCGKSVVFFSVSLCALLGFLQPDSRRFHDERIYG